MVLWRWQLREATQCHPELWMARPSPRRQRTAVRLDGNSLACRSIAADICCLKPVLGCRSRTTSTGLAGSSRRRVPTTSRAAASCRRCASTPSRTVTTGFMCRQMASSTTLIRCSSQCCVARKWAARWLPSTAKHAQSCAKVCLLADANARSCSRHDSARASWSGFKPSIWARIIAHDQVRSVCPQTQSGVVRCKSSNASTTGRLSGRRMLLKSMLLIRAFDLFSCQRACCNQCLSCACTVCSANLTCCAFVSRPLLSRPHAELPMYERSVSRTIGSEFMIRSSDEIIRAWLRLSDRPSFLRMLKRP
jgi:hypothetical protein